MPPRKQVMLDERRRKEILQAAMDLFLQKGFHTTSMSDIARKADISTSHLYNFFENKAALALAVETHMTERIISMLEELASNSEPSQECEAKCYDQIFDVKHWSWVLTIMSESLRNEGLREQFVKNDRKISDLTLERHGYSKDDMERRIRLELAMSMSIGLAIRNIFVNDLPKDVLRNALISAHKVLMSDIDFTAEIRAEEEKKAKNRKLAKA